MNWLADAPRRTKLVAACGLAGTLLATGVLGFGPIVRARAAAAAKQRGIQLRIDRVRLGWGAVWLHDVDLLAPALPGVAAHVDSVRVGLGWHWNVASVALHGAQITLHGDVDELARQWMVYRKRKPEAALSSSEPTYSADGMDLKWRLVPGQPAQYAWGLRYQRAAGRERASVDLVRARETGVELEARRPRLVLAPRLAGEDVNRLGSNARQLESLEADALSVSIALVASPQARNARVEPHAQFQPAPTRGAQLRAILTELAALAARLVRDGAGLNLDGFSLHFQQGSDTLNFGPSSLRLLRLGSEIELSLSPKAEGTGTPLELKLNLPFAQGPVRAQLRGGPVSLRSLGLRVGDFGLSDPQQASIKASGDVTLAGDGSSLAFAGSGAVERLSLRRPELSASLLTGINFEFQGRGTSTLDGSRFALDEADFSLGQLKIQGKGSLTRGDGTLQAHWSGGVPLASCQGFLDALPHGFAPLIASLRMAGTFAVQGQLDYDSEHPDETRVRLGVANDCHIEQVPPELAPSRFGGTWQREVKGPDKQPMQVVSGPGSPDWVPFDSIAPFMETAVLVCEDGRFPYHRGFDFEAIQNSIRDNLIKGRFVRGGSTITMQLAKNLYLRKEKTLGRKLQEAVLTQLLEQELSKRELMELYLNVIEYGPGIYGIGPAARYYFDERASDLSLGQALYIASILPNPEHQHFDPNGKVSAGWSRYLQRLMHIARKIGYISDEQLAQGLTEQVAFRVADPGAAMPAVSPPEEDGTDTPSELSP